MDLKEKIKKFEERARLLDLTLQYGFNKSGDVRFVEFYNENLDDFLTVFIEKEINTITIKDKDCDEIHIEIIRLAIDIHDEFYIREEE